MHLPCAWKVWARTGRLAFVMDDVSPVWCASCSCTFTIASFSVSKRRAIAGPATMRVTRLHRVTICERRAEACDTIRLHQLNQQPEEQFHGLIERDTRDRSGVGTVVNAGTMLLSRRYFIDSSTLSLWTHLTHLCRSGQSRRRLVGYGRDLGFRDDRAPGTFSGRCLAPTTASVTLFYCTTCAYANRRFLSQSYPLPPSQLLPALTGTVVFSPS